MSFLSPIAFALFGLAAPIIILYILKLRRRREPVSTLMFWEQIFKEKQTTSLFQRLRQFLSIFLQLLFLALLVLALAQPQFAFMTRSARQIILIIDRSASMNAVDESVSRLESAKQRATRIMDSLRFIDEMMVISCHTQPVIHSPFTDHQKSLRQAIESIQPTDVRTDLKPALELAYSVAQTKTSPEIMILSDFQEVSDSLMDKISHPPDNVDVLLLQVGSQTGDNVGITRFRVRKSLVNAFDYQTLLIVTNTSEMERQFNVELYFDDGLFDVRPYKLAAGESKSETYSNFAFEGGKLKAALDVDDPLISDNVAYAALPKREKIPVLLVTDGNPFFEKALDVDEKIDLTVVSPGEYDPGTAGYDVVIFDRYNPPAFGDGNYMLIYPPKEGAIWEIGGAVEAPIVTDWEREHPILNFVNLENVQIAEAYQVKPPAAAQVLVRSFEDPLLIVDESPNRKVVFVALNILKSDLPLRIAFPLIVANTIQWFQSQSKIQENHLYTGEILRKKVDAEVETVTITDPSLQTWEIPVRDGELLFDQTSTAGFYELKIGDQQEIWAVNLTDKAESQINTADAVKDMLDEEMSLSSSALLRYPSWIYLVFIAVALSVVEWFLYQRRRID